MKKITIGIVVVMLAFGITSCTKQKLAEIAPATSTISNANARATQPININPTTPVEYVVEIDFSVNSPIVPSGTFSIDNGPILNFTLNGPYKLTTKAMTGNTITFYSLTFGGGTNPQYDVTVKANGVIIAQETVLVNTVPAPLVVTF